MRKYQNGDQVKIRKEWQDSGDDEFMFVAIEDRGDRVLVQAVMPEMRFQPTQVVMKYMIEE